MIYTIQSTVEIAADSEAEALVAFKCACDNATLAEIFIRQAGVTEAQCEHCGNICEPDATCCVLQECDVCGKEATDCELTTLVSSSWSGPAEGGLVCAACREPQPESDAEARGDA